MYFGENMYILAGDLGGTKTLLCLVEFQHENQWHIVHQQRFASQKYVQFDDLLSDFLQQLPIKTLKIHSACLVVAGPVVANAAQQTAKITNLPWLLNQQQLTEKFNLNQLKLINDFQGIGHGIPALTTKDVLCLQAAPANPNAPCVIIGAGTGLGEAVLLQNCQPPQVIPSEGGHTGFAPETEQQLALLNYLRQKYPRVTYEQLLSGGGLLNIYQFLRDSQAATAQTSVETAINQQDAAAVISQQALNHDDRLCEMSMTLFCQIYASQAANLALTCLAYGGVYIAGGIAAKNLPFFQQAEFLQAFRAKQPMAHLLAQMPLYVIRNEQVGLLGAILVAGRLA